MRIRTSTLGLLVLALMVVPPAHSDDDKTLRSETTTYTNARVADHEEPLRLEVGPYVRLIFHPGTFSEDTAVAAHLDVEARRLTISTRGGVPSREPIAIRAALPDLANGLQVDYQHRDDDGSTFEGTLVDSADEPLPQIVALTTSGLEAIAIDRSTSVVLADNSRRGQRVGWRDLAYGDRVRVRYGSGRRATSIEGLRMSGEGVVERVSGDRLMLAGNPDALVVSRYARFVEKDGTQFELGQLNPKDTIELRLDPQTRRIWHVTRTAAAVAEKPRLVVTHDGQPPLLPGDRVRIIGQGEPGGEMTIDIAQVENDLRAEELIGEPGTYELRYTIPRGIELDDAAIVARLDLPDGTSQTVLAEQPLVFTGVAGGSAWDDSGTAEKPEAPVLTSPEDGATIDDSLTIAGTASPNGTVRVVVDFAVTRSIVLLGEGRLLEKELQCDSRGGFSTGELPAKVDSIFGGDTDYTITVTAVSRDGVESDPTVVHARRPD
jgi:hypothetical protein